MFELPFLTEATPYTVSIFFLAWFSIKQKNIFAFREKDIKEISDVLEYEDCKTDIKVFPVIAESANDIDAAGDVTEVSEPAEAKPKLKRLSAEQVANLSVQLSSLDGKWQTFSDNDLNLVTVAEKLGTGIHETSFLINETTKDNFYNFINKYRIEEAKKLLASAKMDELNILGIAFASGFNSKTTFNTTLKELLAFPLLNTAKNRKNNWKICSVV